MSEAEAMERMCGTRMAKEVPETEGDRENCMHEVQRKTE